MVNLTESAVDRAKHDVRSLRSSLSAITQALNQQSRRVRTLAESKRLHPEASWSADESQIVAARIDDLGSSLAELYSLLDSLGANLDAQGREQDQLKGLLRVSQVINATLDIKSLLNLVMDTIIEVMGAERGFLLLFGTSADRGLEGAVARNMDRSSIEGEYEISRSISAQVARDGTPVLTTNAQEDSRFSGQSSIIHHNLRSIICVPLRVKDKVTGVIYVDNRFRDSVFSERDRDLMAGFANQAAVCIDNARLIRDLQIKISEIAAMRTHMANVFGSIASGVVSIDSAGIITTLNRAAENILGVRSESAIGRPYDEVLGWLSGLALNEMLRNARRDGSRYVGQRAKVSRLDGEDRYLSMSLSPLQDEQGATLGTALVFEDLTEHQRLKEAREAEEREKQRIHSVFQRYMAPAVVERILSDPSQIALGGQRQEVTALFADIRGFSPLGASVSPERLVELLNAYLSVAAEAILAEEGTLDKYQGDAVMAVFNAPLPQPDHSLRAARAALALQRALARHRTGLDGSDSLRCGIGINTGEGVVGNIGAAQMMNYTVIGDAVNMAKRLQELAAPDQILLSAALHDQIREHVITRPLPPITLKGHDEPESVYELLGMADELPMDQPSDLFSRS